MGKSEGKIMSSYVRKKTPGDTDWFVRDRFGMFIHFGLYSMTARHEWIKKMEEIDDEKYDKYFKYFNPDMFDAREWARTAKAAGMKYAVLTTKHHEGFCLFDSEYTDYKSTNTPYGRDIVREYVDAFRAEGLKVGLYYSLLDWHHPDYTIDRMHPMRNIENVVEVNRGRDMKKYAEYMRNQVRELLTNYGKIDILWFDFSFEQDEEDPCNRPWLYGKGKEDWESEKLIKMVRELQPDIIINNRTGIDQDIWTPEQVQAEDWVKDEKTGELLTWEACQTFSGAWGYSRDEMSWKSPKLLIDLLINTVSAGGNLIMNVGPTSRGCFDYRAVEALGVYKEWMKYNSRSIYDCTMAEPEFTAPRGCRLTQSNDGKRLYIHLIEYPVGGINLQGFEGKIDYAQFLHDGSEVIVRDGHKSFWEKQKGNAFIELPSFRPNVTVPVVELILK